MAYIMLVRMIFIIMIMVVVMVFMRFFDFFQVLFIFILMLVGIGFGMIFIMFMSNMRVSKMRMTALVKYFHHGKVKYKPQTTDNKHNSGVNFRRMKNSIDGLGYKPNSESLYDENRIECPYYFSSVVPVGHFLVGRKLTHSNANY